MPKADEVFATCSFCLKSNTEVEKLVAGPGVYICNECVSLCTEVIATSPESVDDPVMPWETQADLDALLANLPPIAAVGNQVEDNLVAWVGRARSLGATWAQVGESLGIARQSAWERFAAKVGDAT